MALSNPRIVLYWLPFVRLQPPPTDEEFAKEFRTRHSRINERYGRDDAEPREYFRLSRWGRRANEADVAWLFPEAE